MEQCGLVRMALCGEAGAGGVTDALRTIEAQLNAILAQEEQNRAVAATSKGPRGKRVGQREPSSTSDKYRLEKYLLSERTSGEEPSR